MQQKLARNARHPRVWRRRVAAGAGLLLALIGVTLIGVTAWALESGEVVRVLTIDETGDLRSTPP